MTNPTQIEKSSMSDIEQLARDLVWSPDSWDAYTSFKDDPKNAVGFNEETNELVDPEFFLLAEAVVAKFGPKPPEPEDLAYADKVIEKVRNATEAEVDEILRKADIEPESLVNEFIARLGRELAAATRQIGKLKTQLAQVGEETK